MNKESYSFHTKKTQIKSNEEFESISNNEFISLQFSGEDPYGLDELIGLGFGYDAKSNDYKLVRISYSKMVGGKVYSKVDVYSLR